MTENIRDYAIGVFDSGLGGLTVVKALMRCLPYEDIVYFGDTARVPYGTKSREAIVRFSIENTALLLERRVKMIVVACNSSSSHALAALRETYKVPIVGVIEPGCRRAVRMTKNKRIGVIATPATINSYAYPQEIARTDSTIKVVGQACPLFVPLVEEGWYNKDVTIAVAREYLKKIIRSRADTLILGCTHYPLLKNALRKVLGAKVTLVDSAEVVALDVREQLARAELNRSGPHKAKYSFLVSDEPAHFQKLARRFLGFEIGSVERCNS